MQSAEISLDVMYAFLVQTPRNVTRSWFSGVFSGKMKFVVVIFSTSSESYSISISLNMEVVNHYSSTFYFLFEGVKGFLSRTAVSADVFLALRHTCCPNLLFKIQYSLWKYGTLKIFLSTFEYIQNRIFDKKLMLHNQSIITMTYIFKCILYAFFGTRRTC